MTHPSFPVQASLMPLNKASEPQAVMIEKVRWGRWMARPNG